MEQIKVTLTKGKETPGTFVYSTTDRDAAVTSLYIKKSALGDTPPASVTVTVDPAP
jgi:hypothetical protein